MELSHFAEQILFGSKLSDKFVAPESPEDFIDLKPGRKIDIPGFPGRPASLSLNRSDKIGSRAAVKSERFPGRNAFENDAGRGMVLHFFANHELLALELMALALLRFTDAPIDFRQGIARTMLEEQEHLRLYIERMGHLGVEFGQLPVNAFFWNCLSPMRNPMEYVTQLSMTFEQANVDYAAHYRDLFQKIGDEPTAGVLDQVYRDEIGHVKYGVSWFEKWRNPDQTQWDAWVSHLNFPVTPSRARGIGFEESARHAMGLSNEYIETLRVFSLSKGRQPKVFLFRPGFEEELASSPKVPGALATVEADLAPLMLFLARRDDVVVVPTLPSAPWLASIQEAGFELPQLVRVEDLVKNPERFAPSGFRSFHPWGWSPQTLQALSPLAGKLLSAKTHSPAAQALWKRYATLAQSAHQYASKEFLEKIKGLVLEQDGGAELAKSNALTFICRSPEDVRHAMGHIREAGFTSTLLKPCLAASGRGHVRVTDFSDDFIAQIFTKQNALLAEPLYDRVCDFSIQMTVHPDGAIQEHGIVRLLCDDRGQYKGHVIRKTLAGLDREIKVAADGGHWFARLRAAARLVGDCLAKTGYEGPYGIDAFAYRRGDSTGHGTGYDLRPLVEVNTRFTMGRVALEIERSIPHGTVGFWRHFSGHEIKKMGYHSFVDFYAALKAPEGGKVVATNDPLMARMLLSVLVTGKTLAECEAVLPAMGPSGKRSQT